MQRSLEWLGGSILVYVLVAACSGAGGRADDGPRAVGGMGGIEGGSSTDAPLFDSPVSDALADQHTSGSRLKARWYVGADGSRQFAGWFDTDLEVNCDFFYLAADGKRRCMPTGTATIATGYYTDPRCTSPLLIVTKGCARPKYTTITYVPGTLCVEGARFQIHRVGAPLAANATVYWNLLPAAGDAGSCSAAPGNPHAATHELFASNGVAPPTDFVEATEQHD